MLFLCLLKTVFAGHPVLQSSLQRRHWIFWSQILEGTNTCCLFLMKSLCNSPVNPLCCSVARNFSLEVTVLFPKRTPCPLRSVLAQWLEQGRYCQEQWVQNWNSSCWDESAVQTQSKHSLCGSYTRTDFSHVYYRSPSDSKKRTGKLQEVFAALEVWAQHTR